MKAGKILRNTLTVGSFTALSRVLGLVREMFQSRLIGAGMEQSAFALAFALPNMARKLFGEGALTAAFVPVFRSEVEKVGLEKAGRLARAVMSAVFAMLAAGCALSMGALGLVAKFATLSERGALIVSLVETLLPYMLFICGAAFGMGVLNALGRFKASSFMPALLNILWISALAVLAFFPQLTAAERAKAVAWAILAAGCVQMIFMLVCMARAGVAPRITLLGWRDDNTRLVWKNLAIAAMGAGAVQINYMLDQTLAQLANPWAAGVISYAERLMDLPLGIIGVAFGTVLLPTFSGLFAKNDIDGARNAFSSSVTSLMFAILPAAAGLLVLSREVTAVIYQGGGFDALATTRVSRSLAVYAAGLGFFGYMKTIVPWFQAQHDMKTPLRVSVWTVCINATLNILAVFTLPVEWRHVGLALSTVICSATGCTILTVLAKKKNGVVGLGKSIPSIIKIAVASTLMGCAVYALKGCVTEFAASIFDNETLERILALAILVVSGGVIYLALAALMLRRRAKGLGPRAMGQGI